MSRIMQNMRVMSRIIKKIRENVQDHKKYWENVQDHTKYRGKSRIIQSIRESPGSYKV